MTLKDLSLFTELFKTDYVLLWYKNIRTPFKGKIGEPFRIKRNNITGYINAIPFTESGQTKNIQLSKIVDLEPAA